MRAPHVLSIDGWSCQLPSPASVAGNVAPPVCPLALVAARAPRVVIGEAAQNDNRRATTPDGPEAVAPVERWSRCDEEAAAIPWRTVRSTRSMNAVLSRPEKPSPCKVAVRAASVKRRMMGVTRTNLRQRSAFFYLTVDQVLRHLPPKHVAPSASHLVPVSKMGRECIKVQV